MIDLTDMHETLKSKSQRNTTGSSYADEQEDYSRFHLTSPKLARVKKGDTIKSVSSSQVPSTKLGLYKALQPLFKLASPSRLDGSVLLLYCVDLCCFTL